MTSGPPPAGAPGHALRHWLLVALAAVVFAATVELLPAAGARLRVVLAVTALWFGAAAWLGRRVWLAPPYAPTVPIAMAATYALVALSAAFAGDLPVDTDYLAAYCALSVGWATFFLLARAQRPVALPEIQIGRRHAWLLVAAAGGIALIAHGLATPRWPLVSDEAIYWLQSEWFFRPNYAWAVPREIADFFVMRKFGYNDAAQHFYGMYPPGWPAVLALFDLVGLRWMAPVVLAAASVGLTFLLGSMLYSRQAGFIAAALLAVQQWFVTDFAGYMSDGFTTFATVAGGVTLVAAERARAVGGRIGWGALAGLALGMGVAARPLSGLALGTLLVLWIALRRRMDLRGLAATGMGLVLGGILPAVLLLHYNHATNGEALRLAYQAMHGHGYDLGFGVRGFYGYTAALERVQIPIPYTPADGAAHFAQRLADFGYAAFGIGLLVPLLALARVHRLRLRPWLVAPFLLLPFTYFFYWYSGIRYYTCLLPFLFVGCAVLLLELSRRTAWMAGGLLVTAFAGSVYFALPFRTAPGGLASPWTTSAYFRDPGRMGTLDSLAALGEREGPLLVFARQQDNPFDNLLDRLQLLNADGLDSRVLVARDLGPRNVELRARHPDRRVYIVEDRGRDSLARIIPGDSLSR